MTLAVVCKAVVELTAEKVCSASVQSSAVVESASVPPLLGAGGCPALTGRRTECDLL